MADSPLRLAFNLRAELIRVPGCQLVEVAGSLRREKADPHDLELCALVDPDSTDLFGEAITKPTMALVTRLAGMGRQLKGGDRYAQFEIAGWQVDFFQTAADGTPHPTPDETAVFAALRWPVVEPRDRTAETAARLNG